MSQDSSDRSSSSNYQLIFDNALEAYKKKTGKDLASDPLFRRLQSCDSPDTVLNVLREQIPGFDQSGSSNDRLTRWVKPTVNVLYTFSSTIGSAVSLAYPPAGMMFTGIGTLLSAAQGVSASQDALLDILERIENVFIRLESYAELPPTKAMTDIIVKVMVEVLLVLALVTKEIKQGKLRRFLKKVAGRSEIEDALRRLDKLTQEEHRMATAQDLRGTHRVDDKIDVVLDDAEHMKRELRQVAANMGDQKQDKLLTDLAKWLSPPDPFINYNTASEARYDGTSLWFTNSSEYKDWKESTSLLWIQGKPGAGKSVITSAIIEDIKGNFNSGSAHVAFFFFDFKDTRKQDARALLSSLIVQLSSRTQPFYRILFDFYSAHKPGLQQPGIGALTKCLEDMIKASGDVPIYLILGALDECPNTKGMPSSRDQVLDLVEKLATQPTLNVPRFHLCITSRPEIDIRSSLEPLVSPCNRISLHDQSGQKKDIANFIRGVVYSDKNMRRWRDEDKELVIETLSDKADGMFRWVHCQLEILRQCLPSSVRSVLAELPESLDETYERILQQIPKPNRVHAHRLLQCLVVAMRPLCVEELAEALAIDFSTTGATPMMDETLRWEDKEHAVLSTCSTLITLSRDGSSRQVQFSHFSVKEFLTSDRLAISMVETLRSHHIRLEPAHTFMAQACLSVLLRLDYHMDKQTIKSHPLADYAARHFGDHVEFENIVTDRIDALLDPDKPHFLTWVWLQIGDWNSKQWHNSKMNRDRHPRITARGQNTKPKFPPRLPPLYYVAALGHLCLAHRLISMRPQDLHVRDNKGCTPLHIAVLAGKEKVAQLLIKHSVDLDIRDINDRTLLHMAAYKRLANTAQMLVEHDGPIKVCVDARDKEGRTALHIASQRHDPIIVALLLKTDAEVNAEDNDGMTPLLLALRRRVLVDYSPDADTGVTETAQLLLEHGASVHVRNENGQTPLCLASQYELSGIVASLMKFGADVDAPDNYSTTPLLLALQSKSAAKAEILLEHGAGVHMRNKNGQTPLHLASQHGLPSIVTLLLKLGADVDTLDIDSMTPLHLASRSEGVAEVEILLGHGASVHVRNKNGQTPLHLASYNGLSSIVALLLKFSADVDAQDNDSTTPLLFALHQPGIILDNKPGITKTAQLLLEHGASVHVRNKNGQTPLHPASQHGLSSIVALLLELGMDVDAQDNDGMTPLLFASQQSGIWTNRGITKTVKLLLERSASIHMRNKNGQTPLHLASRHGLSNVVILLLELGGGVDVQDNDNMTPLHLASQSGGATKAAILLEQGANIHLRNKNGQTPLHLASQHGLSSIVALLLKFGAEVDAQDNDGMAPLTFASQQSEIIWANVPKITETSQLLLERGASVHVRNKNGQTPLHIASGNGLPNIVALLLKLDAEVDAKDDHNMTPLHLAVSFPLRRSFSQFDKTPELKDLIDVIKLLLEHSASVQVQNNKGETLFQAALARGEQEIIHLLSVHMQNDQAF